MTELVEIQIVCSLPKSTTIVARKFEPSEVSDEKLVIIRSIATEFRVPVAKIPKNQIFLARRTDQPQYQIFEETAMETAKKAKTDVFGTPLFLNICKPSPLFDILDNWNVGQRNHTGTSISYETSPDGQLSFHFHLDSSKIFETLDEAIESLKINFNPRSRSILSTILKENENRQENADDIDNIDKFFDLLEKYKQKLDDAAKIVIPQYRLKTDQLNHPLLPFQKETVRWMCHREDGDVVEPRPAWIRFAVLPTCSLLYYPNLGVVCRRRPKSEEKRLLLKSSTLKGGILADEAGLGKTVQVLLLIATHRKDEPLQVMDDEEPDSGEDKENCAGSSEIEDRIRIAKECYEEMKSAKESQSDLCYTSSSSSSNSVQCTVCEVMCSAAVCGWKPENHQNDPFTCPECISKSGVRQPIRTTLIVVPDNLIFQWSTEIGKHCSDRMKVMFYFGLDRNGYLPASKMDKVDVILTTYKTLANDFFYSDTAEPIERSTRTKEKLHFVTTSLVHVKFWRLIVDEAQIIPSGTNTQLAKMFSKIEAENRWCVSGTPLVKSVADVAPLLSFLDIWPMSDATFFSKVVHPQYQQLPASSPDHPAPHNLLMETLARWMSRRTRQQVEKQLAIPELVEIEKKIRFSAIEERLYKQELDRSRRVIKKLLRDSPGDALLSTHPDCEQVLAEVKYLRKIILTGQACRSGQSGQLGVDGLIDGPETAIFKLVNGKKTGFRISFAQYVGYSLESAELDRDREEEAMKTYESIDETYEEVLEVQKYIEETIKVEDMAKFGGDGDGAEVDTEARRSMQIARMFIEDFKRRDGDEPPRKIPRIEDEVAREVQLRENYTRQYAQLALEPIAMHEIQQVRLAIGRQNLRKAMGQTEEVWTVEKVAPAIRQFFKENTRAIEYLQKELPVVNSAFGQLFEKMSKAFREKVLESKSITDSSHFMTSDKKIVPILRMQLLPLLPFSPMYSDDAHPTTPNTRHTVERCMGGCSKWHRECSLLAEKNHVLPLPKVFQKTADHLRVIADGRKKLHKKLEDVIEFFKEVSEPATLMKLLHNRHRLTSKMQRLDKMFKCQPLSYGSKDEQEEPLIENKEIDRLCDICQMKFYYKKLQFDSGFSSFHGHLRHKSSVVSLIRVLTTNCPDEGSGYDFVISYVHPYFRKLEKAIEVYTFCVPILLQFAKGVQKLFEDSKLADVVNIRRYFPTGQSAEALQMLRGKFTNGMERRRVQVLKVLKELRFLVNQMKERVNGTETENNCAVCQIPLEEFVVFQCGHHTCSECFVQLRQLNRRGYVDLTDDDDVVHIPSAIACPTCRAESEAAQVTIASRLPAPDEQIIPGVHLSAKLHCAIALMREIIKADESSKVVVLTDAIQWNPAWVYLRKVLKTAKMPFWELLVAPTGREVADFETSDDSILVCLVSMCADGLNMTGANHLIFLDPPSVRSVVQQAIGRINRCGQKKNMKVYHIVIEDSLDIQFRASAKSDDGTKKEESWSIGQVRDMFGC